ncbi:hypothetical protein AMECASPLE_026607 [Ameca splendens]|uniref:Uncharacterized protein n=1 Tax=Ameca splendens TaxID=208324 RepID=A0ABV0XHW9_9TELE
MVQPHVLKKGLLISPSSAHKYIFILLVLCYLKINHPIKAELDTGFSSSYSCCHICPYKGVQVSAVIHFFLHSASVLQYNNMNVAGVNPSVFFVSKNVVPFVNSKENY